MNWADEVFKENQRIKEKKRQQREAQRKRRQKEKRSSEEKVTLTKEGFFDRLKRVFNASYDVATVDKTEEPTVVEDESENIVTGHDVTYIVPDDMRKLRIRILESNGRLINQYTLTNYITVEPGNKFHIIVE